jgi:hypothetical protein
MSSHLPAREHAARACRSTEVRQAREQDMERGREQRSEDIAGKEDAREVSPQEVQAVLFDAGYGGDGRRDWLKTVLTELAKEAAEERAALSGDKARLTQRVKAIIARYQEAGEPMSNDTL